MEIYRVSFFGHRRMEHFRLAEDMANDLIYKLIHEHEFNLWNCLQFRRL